VLTIVTWIWSQKGRSVVYKPESVNVWANMVSRNITIPHRFLCFAEDSQGIEIPTYPLWEDIKVSRSDWGNHRPHCYRRLKAFSEDMRPILGDRFVSMDLDCVVTGNLDEILGRNDDFIINRGTTGKNTYNGSMWMMNTGARKQVWEDFTEIGAKEAARHFLGSDQSWIRYKLGPFEKTWGPEHGVNTYLALRRIYDANLKNTNLVFFQGTMKPWESTAQEFSWVRQNYR